MDELALTGIDSNTLAAALRDGLLVDPDIFQDRVLNVAGDQALTPQLAIRLALVLAAEGPGGEVIAGQRITPERPAVEFGGTVAESEQQTATTLDLAQPRRRHLHQDQGQGAAPGMRRQRCTGRGRRNPRRDRRGRAQPRRHAPG
ncbi:hypothetical protein [Streptomyces qinglanensis]|uniref:hypothetical protein n=1 Tax=Streptomyces qinglanensis TaxID=943816 RepID=UPI00378C212C